jgi:Activator of Hsp90 ATPase homolog 1-like protein
MSLRKDVAVQAVIKRRIAAPRERVFQAWTKAEQLQRWFFPTVDGDAVVTHEHLDEPTAPPQHTIGWNCSLERLTQLVEAGASHRTLVAQSDPCH